MEKTAALRAAHRGGDWDWCSICSYQRDINEVIHKVQGANLCRLGYEPELYPVIYKMSTLYRRRATHQELRQGEQEMQAAQERLERENQDLPLEDKGEGLEGEQKALVAAETSIVASEEKREKESETAKPIRDAPKSPSIVEPTPGSEKGKVGSAVSLAVPISPQDQRQQAACRALESPGQGVGTATPNVTQPQSSRDGKESVANGPNVGFTATPQTPLFTNEQLMQWRVLEEQAPPLIPPRLDMAYNMPLQCPQLMEFEEARLIEERRRHEELRQHVEVLMMENKRLSKRVEELESKQVEAADEYHMPDRKGTDWVSIRKEAADHQKDAADLHKDAADPQGCCRSPK